jgi:sterol-4alpha-carboxylate 3-dehydrogenase (decarboxylating)
VIFVLDLSIHFNSNTSNVVYHQIDICDATALSHLINNIQPQVLIHSAALIPNAAKRLGVGCEGLRRVNIQGTRNVLRAAKDTGSVQAFVYTSSCDVVKGDSWANLVNVDESCPLPQVFDEIYPETKVRKTQNLRCQSVTSTNQYYRLSLSIWY